MCPWLPEGPPGTQWAPAVIRGHPDFWATGRLGGPGSRKSLIAWGPLVTSGGPRGRVTWRPLREQVAPSWTKSWVRAWQQQSCRY